MNKKLFFMAMCLIISVNSFGQSLTIARLNTPTINIDGKECKVGDSFKKSSKVNWKDAKQVIIAKDADGKMVRMSAAAAEGKSGYSVEKLIGLQKSYKHLSTRSIEDEIEVAGEYIIDETVRIPTGMDSDMNYSIEILYNYDGETISYKPTLSDDKTEVVVDRKIYKDKTPKTIKVKMMCSPEDDETFCVSEDIVIVPLEAALDVDE